MLTNVKTHGLVTEQTVFARSKEHALQIFNSENFQQAYQSYKENVKYYNDTFDRNHEAIDYIETINFIHGEEPE